MAGVYRFIPPRDLISRPASVPFSSSRHFTSLFTNQLRPISTSSKGYTLLLPTPVARFCQAKFLLSLEFLCTDILFSVLGYWLRSAGPNARFRVSGLYGETATTSCSQGCNGPLSQRAPIFRSDIYDHVPSCSPAYLSLSANKSKGAGNSYQLAETWIAEGIPR